MELLPESTQVVYSQLLDELLRATYSKRGISFVTREVKGATYWYLQYVVGSSKQSYYLGPDGPELRGRVEAAKALWESDEASAEQRARLVAMLRAGGATVLPSAQARVLEVLEQAGVFLLGAVVVGSHAFALLANLLGVKWDRASMRTQDIDLARDYAIRVTVPDVKIDLAETLRAADKAFFAVPALNRKHPSTSFAIRGKELSVSLLTPMRGKTDSTPRALPSLGAMAEPVRFLEYVLDDVQPAAVPVRSGVLVNLPSPARFALHKLVVSQRRPAAFATKANKDVTQANAVLEALLDDRPGDLYLAVDAARNMPGKFMQQLEVGLARASERVRAGLQPFLSG